AATGLPDRGNVQPRSGTGTDTYRAPALRWTWNVTSVLVAALCGRVAQLRGRLVVGRRRGVPLRRRGLRRPSLLGRLGHGDRQRVLFRVRPRLLVRWPRPWHRLARDLQVVHQLGPGPHGGALPRLRCPLDQLVQAGITAAVP